MVSRALDATVLYHCFYIVGGGSRPIFKVQTVDFGTTFHFSVVRLGDPSAEFLGLCMSPIGLDLDHLLVTIEACRTIS